MIAFLLIVWIHGGGLLHAFRHACDVVDALPIEIPFELGLAALFLVLSADAVQQRRRRWG